MLRRLFWLVYIAALAAAIYVPRYWLAQQPVVLVQDVLEQLI